MSSLWVKTWKNTPQIDCGLCGEATCASFSRAIVVGNKQIEACPLLGLDKYKDRREELERLSKRKPTLVGKPAAKLPEGGMLLTRPCQDTDEKVMAELRVYNGVEAGNPIHYGVFEPAILCDLMDCIAGNFELIRCSRDLGYGRAEIEDMSITILQDGRVNMRRVSDEERVLQLFKQIERALFGSIICNCCGHDALSVIAGFAPSEKESHPILTAGSTLSLDHSSLDLAASGEGFRFQMIDDSIVATLDSAKSHLDAFIDKIAGHDFSITANEKVSRERFCTIVNAAASTEDDSDFTVAMNALAVLQSIENALRGLLGLQEILRISSESIVIRGLELLQDAIGGQLDPTIKPAADNVEIIAHLSRVNRAMNLLRELKW
ncbi:MAG: (Fe-S)-binding protein [Candidatus Thorarchaeota archaeon]|jgi:hypothetical protein